MTKMKNYASKDCIPLDVIIKRSITSFGCQYKENKQHKKMEMTSNLYYVQRQQKVKRGKYIKGVSFYLLKFVIIKIIIIKIY